jgi:glycosyltransferase involved in cell wall biosynthesis
VRVLLDVSAVPAQPVGAGVYTVALASGLARRRADVELHVLARRHDAERWSRLAPGATLHAEVPSSRPARLAWEQVAGPRLAQRVGADVWHGPHYTMPLRMAVPAVVTIHDMTFFDHPEWHERAKVAFFRRMIIASAARARVLVCVSEYTAACLRAHTEPRGSITVIPHGVDFDRFGTTGETTEATDETTNADLGALAEHGISPPYIAFVGTIEPRKDVPTLVRGFARVAARHHDVRLVVVGADGWGAAGAREAIVASGVATRVVRPGYLDDRTLAALYRHAAVVAYPSREEGFGLPALEALAFGAPLVTTQGSALAEVAGDAAVLVPPGDDAALGDAMSAILDDDALARELRRAGPKRAADYTWDRSVDLHVDAYARALTSAAVR